MYIYKITNKLNDKCYIGKTCNVNRRFYEHKICKNSSIGSDIIRYGESNFSFDILLRCNQRDASLLESCLIIEYDSINNGYNKILSKIRHNLDFKKAEAIVDSILNNTYIYTTENMNNRSIDNVSVLCLEDDIIFDSIYECRIFYGICSSSHIKEVCEGKRATANGKHFRYVSDDGDICEPTVSVREYKSQIFVEETNCVYDSISEACDSLGLNYQSCKSAISKCLKGQRATAFKYHWRYFDGGEAIASGRVNQHFKKVIIDLNPEYIFNSVKEAAEFIGVTPQMVTHCIRGRCKTAGGYKCNEILSDGTILYN